AIEDDPVFIGWKEAIAKLKRQGKVQAWGISINRWEPNNCLQTLQTGLIDAVQVIYNIFDQAPEDKLFPLCRKLNLGVIARVPFDEGTLTGTMTKETTFPKEDWRSTYFVPHNLNASINHADALKPLIPQGISMPEMALRFILSNPDVSVTIPGMRKLRNVVANMSAGDGKGLPEELLQELKQHRWDREPTEWSQ
ncbi:MAG: aldo/keto reductase, partial [Ginsengibacter sp.]